MANIIAGIVETEEAAERALTALQAQGLGKDDLTTFYLNPPGQHATYPIGVGRVAAGRKTGVDRLRPPPPSSTCMR